MPPPAPLSPALARAFWITGPGAGAIRTVPVAPAAEGSVRVRTLYSGISRGTEMLVYKGRVPPSQYRAMRCPFQEGDFPFPLKYGYAAAGIVEEGPPSLLGQVVFCLYPHQDRFVVPTTAVFPLPASVPPERAILAANMETAVNALWDAEIGAGDRLAIVGAGVVGLLVTYLAAKIPGVTATALDTDPAKAEAIMAMGGTFAGEPPTHPDFDVVIHASGNPAGLATALALCGFEARVIELSWYGDQPVTLPLGESFHSKRLSVRSSQVGAIPLARRARWSHARRLATALALLADPRLDALITDESAFAALPEVMADLADSRSLALCHRIHYRP